MNSKNKRAPNFNMSNLRIYEMCDGQVDFETRRKAFIELGLMPQFPIRW